MAEHAQFLWPNALSEVRRNVSPGKHPICGNLKRGVRGSAGSAEARAHLPTSPSAEVGVHRGPRWSSAEDISGLGLTLDIPVTVALIVFVN